MPSLITDILRDIINDEKKANEFAIKAANYQKNADYENAEKYYIQALHYQWNNAIYWNGIAWSRLLANKADEFALNVVNTAILFDNQNHYIRDTKACIQAQLGLISEAINEWRYALALNPGNQNYQNKLFKALGTVFISYGFNDNDKPLAEGLKGNFDLLQGRFEIVTGEKIKIGESILEKVRKQIRRCYFLVAILTRKQKMGNENYTASSWIITEAAIANALNREVIFLVEEGIDVDQFSCINGNLQYIEFNRNNFAYRCTEVVKAIEARRVQLFTAKINE